MSVPDLSSCSGAARQALEGGSAARKRLPVRTRGVAEGTRTPDHRDHNPGLYQLSYRHREAETG